MSVFDKVGREIIKFFIDSERERAGQKMLFVFDLESQKILEKNKELLEKILKQLEKINS